MIAIYGFTPMVLHQKQGRVRGGRVGYHCARARGALGIHGRTINGECVTRMPIAFKCMFFAGANNKPWLAGGVGTGGMDGSHGSKSTNGYDAHLSGS